MSVPVSTTVVGTGVVVAAGRWAKNQPLTMRPVIAVGFMAIALSFLSQVDDGLANGFGVLILATVTLTYGTDIVKKLGLTK